MTTRKWKLGPIVGLICAFAPLPAAQADTGPDCRLGSYKLADGDVVDVAASEGGTLRWRRLDGRSGALTRGEGDSWTSTLGWTKKPDGIAVSFDCDMASLIFNGIAGKRIAFDVTETRFETQGATLAGRLVMPKGKGKVPIVILVHGSEHNSALTDYAFQRLFPASGIGAFVYDKRGTGISGGQYTQSYLTLAVDAIAALHEAKRLAGDRVGRIGYQGGSQGGWVVPLAAVIEPVDYTIISFGLAVSAFAAEREALALDLTEQGFGAQENAKANELFDAVEGIFKTNFQDGYDALYAVRDKYQAEPWFSHARGGFTYLFLEMPKETLMKVGPGLAPNIPANYDPMPVLRRLDVPQFWALGGADHVAPAGETAKRLRALAEAGKPIRAIVYPGAEHGLYEFEVSADGEHLSTHLPAGYFATMVDFIKGK